MSFTPYQPKTTAPPTGFKPYKPGTTAPDTALGGPGTAPGASSTPPKPSGTMAFLSSVSNAFGGAGKAYRDFSIGALKGAGSTIAGVASLGEKALNVASEKMFPNIGIKGSDETAGQKAQESDVLKSKGTAQAVGKGAEQIAEFFIPIGAETKAKALLESGEAAAKIAKTLNISEKAVNAISKTAEFATKGVVEGGEQAVRAAAQEGTVDKNVAVAGALGAAAPVLEKAGSLASKLGDFFYSRAIPTTITQAGKDIQKGLNIGEAVSKTGVSFTRKSLVEKIGENVSALGKKLDSAIDAAVQKGGEYDIGNLVEDTKAALSDSFLAKKMQLSPVDIDTAKQAVLDRLGQYEKLYGGKSLNEADLQKIKTELGTGLETVYKKALDVPVKAKALADMGFRSTLKKTIERAVPEASELNKAMAPLLEATGRILKKGEYSGYLTDIIAGGFAAGNIGDIISDPIGYFKKFAEGIIVKRIGTSTTAKTTAGAVSKGLEKIISSPGFAQAMRRLFELSGQGGEQEPDAKDGANSQ